MLHTSCGVVRHIQYKQWRNRGTIQEALLESLLEKTLLANRFRKIIIHNTAKFTCTKPKERNEAMAINKHRKLQLYMYAGCAMQDFSDRQNSFESYAV